MARRRSAFHTRPAHRYSCRSPPCGVTSYRSARRGAAGGGGCSGSAGAPAAVCPDCRGGGSGRCVDAGVPAVARPAERLSHVDRDLRDAVAASPPYHAKADLLRSVPGVGPVTAVRLLASLSEPGRLSRHEIAALVHDAGFATAKDSRDCATLNIRLRLHKSFAALRMTSCLS